MQCVKAVKAECDGLLQPVPGTGSALIFTCRTNHLLCKSGTPLHFLLSSCLKPNPNALVYFFLLALSLSLRDRFFQPSVALVILPWTLFSWPLSLLFLELISIFQIWFDCLEFWRGCLGLQVNMRACYVAGACCKPPSHSAFFIPFSTLSTIFVGV